MGSLVRRFDAFCLAVPTEIAPADIERLRESHQVSEADIEGAVLILAMATEHVAYIRRRHPEAAPRTATIKRLCRDLADGPAPLADRVRALGLAGLPIEAWEDVEDPAGGDDGVYVSCAEELAGLCAQLRPRLL